MTRQTSFSGRHFLFLILAAFGVVIVANLTLAYFAIGSFPGLDIDNTYVASQQFEHKKQAQQTLGWTTRLDYKDGRIELAFSSQHGAPVYPESLTLRVGRPATDRHDHTLRPQARNGVYSAEANLPAGYWIVYINAAAADGTAFTERRTMVIR